MKHTRFLTKTVILIMILGIILPTQALERYCGDTRYETAVSISQEGWVDGSDVVILARSDDFADALAGATLAHKYKAPVLLTRPNSLPEETLAEIHRLDASTVYLLGGESAISAEIQQQLGALGLEIIRIGGSNRYETAADIAWEVAPSGVDTALIVYSNNPIDALVAASYAAAKGYPILLTNTNTLNPLTAELLDELGVEDTFVIGGTKVISDKVMGQLPNPERIWGADRYSTAIALAKRFAPNAEHIYIANGSGKAGGADAITGGPLAAIQRVGILLVDKNLPDSVIEYLSSSKITDATILGGTGAVNEDIIDLLTQIFNAKRSPGAGQIGPSLPPGPSEIESAIAAAQQAIEALEAEVAGASNSQEAQGFIDSAQGLVDAVLALDSTYDTNSWDTAILVQLSIVSALVALEDATEAVLLSEAKANALSTPTAGDITDALEAYNNAAELVFALPDSGEKDYLESRLDDVKASMDASINATIVRLSFTGIYSGSHELFKVGLETTDPDPLESSAEQTEISGYVLDGTDPVFGARVVAWNGDRGYGAFTDSTGFYSFERPDGNYTLQVQAKGYFISSEEITIGLGFRSIGAIGNSISLLNLNQGSGTILSSSNKDWDMSLVTSMVKVSGRITDGNDNPVVNARVMFGNFQHTYEDFTLTDQNGYYELWLPEDDYWKTTIVEGYAPYFSREYIFDDGRDLENLDKTLKFVGSAFFEVQGIVTDTSDNPIPNALILAWGTPGSMDYGVETRSDEAGRYSVMLPSGVYNVWVNSGQHFNVTVENYNVTSERTRNFALVPMGDTTLVSGKITDTNDSGVNIQGASVSFWNEEHNHNFSASTDDSGIYSVELPSLSYRVTIQASGYVIHRDTMVASPEEHNWALEPVGDGFEISGAVIDNNGKPMPGASVYAINDDTGFETYTETDKDGRYSLFLPGGLYWVNIHPAWDFRTYPDINEHVNISDNSSVDWRFEFMTVTGIVTNIDTGEPIADATVSGVDWPNNAITTVTREDGSYSLLLPPGFYELEASHSGYFKEESSEPVYQAINLNWELQSIGEVYPVGGIIHDESDDPLPETRVTVKAIINNRDYSDTVNTMDDGVFQFSLPVGIYDFEVFKQGYIYQELQFEVDSDGNTTLTTPIQMLAVGPLNEIRGKVTNSAEGVIDGAFIYAGNDSWEDFGSTASDGKFLLFLPEGEYYFFITADGYDLHEESLIVTGAAANVDRTLTVSEQ